MMKQAICTAHTEGPEPEKLQELRAKTDRQLVEYIRSKLEAGLNAGERIPAERAFRDVQKVLPALNEHLRTSLEPKLNELREYLQRRYGESPGLAACCGNWPASSQEAGETACSTTAAELRTGIQIARA